MCQRQLQLSGSTSGGVAPGTRDVQFVHVYIVYQLLSRRIQRDLLLISTLLSSHRPQTTRRGEGAKDKSEGSSKYSKPKKEQVDSRLYPALVKLLDTVLQSLNQMRTLSIVDESPDVAAATEARIGYIRGARFAYFLNHIYDG